MVVICDIHNSHQPNENVSDSWQKLDENRRTQQWWECWTLCEIKTLRLVLGGAHTCNHGLSKRLMSVMLTRDELGSVRYGKLQKNANRRCDHGDIASINIFNDPLGCTTRADRSRSWYIHLQAAVPSCKGHTYCSRVVCVLPHIHIPEVQTVRSKAAHIIRYVVAPKGPSPRALPQTLPLFTPPPLTKSTLYE